VVAIVTVVVAGALIFVTVGPSNESSEARGGAIESYTGSIRTVEQSLKAATEAMSQVPRQLSAKAAAKLGNDAAPWIKTVAAAEVRITALTPPAGSQSYHRLFLQATQLYGTAAATFGSAAKAAGDGRTRLVAAAAELRDQAGGVWQSGIEVLDEVRRDVGLDASGLEPPSAPAPVGPESTGFDPFGGGGGGNGGG
jgi:hypothetical protein